MFQDRSLVCSVASSTFLGAFAVEIPEICLCSFVTVCRSKSRKGECFSCSGPKKRKDVLVRVRGGVRFPLGGGVSSSCHEGRLNLKHEALPQRVGMGSQVTVHGESGRGA